jgi:lipopolysaccharide transport system permease protein
MLRIKYLKEIVSSPFIVIKNLYIYRHMLLQMIIREIKGRFAGSMGGLIWNFVHPILLLLVYLFVFVYIFKLRVGSSGGGGTSALYLMAGLFPWIILAEGLSRGTSSLIENANIIQKTFFPTEILPAKAVLTPFLSYGIAIILLILYKIIFTGTFGIIFIILLIILLQIFFTIGIAFLSSTVSVFFRDVMQLIHIIISFWIFLTPILYPVSMLPYWAKKAMYLNPLYPFMSMYQSLFLNGHIGQQHLLILAFIWAATFFVIGAFVFNKLKYEFADWL